MTVEYVKVSEYMCVLAVTQSTLESHCAWCYKDLWHYKAYTADAQQLHKGIDIKLWY